MRYGLSRCDTCGRPRVVDLTKATSSCPYCGASFENSRIPIYFTSNDQGAVREALSQAMGFVPPDAAKKKARIEGADPYSTLVYRYEHCSDLETKMAILAEGLTEIKGTFTMEDVRDIAGAKAEKMVAAMLDRCLISEVRIGVYKARSPGPRDVVALLPFHLQHVSHHAGQLHVHYAIEVEGREDQHHHLADVVYYLSAQLPALQDHGE